MQYAILVFSGMSGRNDVERRTHEKKKPITVIMDMVKHTFMVMNTIKSALKLLYYNLYAMALIVQFGTTNRIS